MAFVFFLVSLFLMSGSIAYGQIGNLGWASGKKAYKKKSKKDYEKSKFQMFIEPGVGKEKADSDEQWYNAYDSTWDTHSDSHSELILDLAMGGVYQAYRSAGTGPQVDASIYFSVGANLVDFDFDMFRLLGVIAPEVGVLLPTQSNLALRPFVSYGPGFSFLNNYSSSGGDEFLAVVGVIRAGIEVGQKKGPLSGVLAIKKIGRGEIEESRYYYKSKVSFSNMLFTLGFRLKL